MGFRSLSLLSLIPVHMWKRLKDTFGFEPASKIKDMIRFLNDHRPLEPLYSVKRYLDSYKLVSAQATDPNDFLDLATFKSKRSKMNGVMLPREEYKERCDKADAVFSKLIMATLTFKQDTRKRRLASQSIYPRRNGYSKAREAVRTQNFYNTSRTSRFHPEVNCCAHCKKRLPTHHWHRYCQDCYYRYFRGQRISYNKKWRFTGHHPSDLRKGHPVSGR